MKTKLSIIVAVIVFMASQLYGVPDKIFISSGHILPGEEWGNVHMLQSVEAVYVAG